MLAVESTPGMRSTWDAKTSRFLCVAGDSSSKSDVFATVSLTSPATFSLAGAGVVAERIDADVGDVAFSMSSFLFSYSPRSTV